MAKIADWDDHIGRRLRLRDLRVFFTVVQSGSLSKAAAQLNVSHAAVSQIIADTMDDMGLKLPPTHVDIADIRRKYHAAAREPKIGDQRRTKKADKVA